MQFYWNIAKKRHKNDIKADNYVTILSINFGIFNKLLNLLYILFFHPNFYLV